MKQKTPLKKKNSRALLLLTPLCLLLAAALVVVSAVYFGGGAEPVSIAPPTPSAEVSEAPQVTPTVPEIEATPEPYRPLALRLDVYSTGENLDVAVCDGEGLAVPGYAFPLEISYEDGTSHSVRTDISGHYYAEYMLPGSYIISMPAMEGFARPDTVRCRVEQLPAYAMTPHIGEVVKVNSVSELPAEQVQSARPAGEAAEIEEIRSGLPALAAAGSTAGSEIDANWFGTQTVTLPCYQYRYSTGEGGYLLYADGSLSDVMPVEKEGVLAYGVRKSVSFYSPYGEALAFSDIPADAREGEDYYRSEHAEKVALILGDGVVDERFAITAEAGEKTVTAASLRHIGWQERDGETYYFTAGGWPLTGLKNIDGKLCYFDDSGRKASALGIDVSYFNASIDWNAVKAAGIDFAIVRVAGRTWEKGILFEDEDSYREGKDGGYYLQGAKAAGLKVGAYVYSNAISAKEAVEEASLAMEIVRRAGVELDMPIYIDYEFSGDYPKGRADRLSFAQRAAIVKAFCKTVESEGYRAGVYSNEDFFERALRLADVADYDVWYAVFTEDFVEPDHREFDIWQFSESIRVNGMPDMTDMNIIF